MHLLKKLLFTTAVVLVCTATTQAKDPISGNRLKLGFKAGVSTSRFNKTIGPYSIPSNGFQADKRISSELGIILRYKLNRLITLQGEVVLDMKGMSYKREIINTITYSSGIESKTYYYNTFCLNYIELPVMAGVNLTNLVLKNNGKGGIFLSTGLAPAYCIESSFKDGGKALAWTNESNERAASIPRKFDYARSTILNVVSELSFNSPIARHTNLFIYCRMMRTAGNVYKVNTLDGLNMKTSMSSLSFGAGIAF